MKNRIFILIVIFVFCFFNSLFALDESDFKYRLEIISVNQGLSQQDVNSIVQDKNGFIWIATYDGLHRYDGSNFKIFRCNSANPKSISDNRVLSLFIDSSSRLWVTTEGGGVNLYDYDNEYFTPFFFHNKNSITDNNVYSMYEDKDKFLWFGTSNGLYKAQYDKNEEILRSQMVKIKWDFSTENIRVITENIDREVFFGTYRGIVKLTKPANLNRIKKQIIYSTILFDKVIYDLKHDSNNNIWIAAIDGLYIYHSTTNKIEKIKLLDNNEVCVRSIVKLNKKVFIIGTENKGIFQIDYSNGQKKIRKLKFEDESFLLKSFLRTLFIDKTQNLWVGTSSSGIAKINLQPKKFYTSFCGNIDGSNFVLFFLKDSQDREWLYTKQKGFSVSMEGKRIAIDLQNNAQPLAITEDKNKNIWITTNSKSIYLFKANKSINNPTDITLSDQFPKTIVKNIISPTSIKEDFLGNIWIGTMTGLIQIVNPAGNNPIYHFYDNFGVQKGKLSFITIYCEKDKPRIWVCSRIFGLFLIELDSNGNIKQKSRFFMSNIANRSLNSNHVWSVVKSSKGVIWVGTDSGINSIEFINGKPFVKKYDNVERLKGDKILGIVEDNNQDLWLNTSIGLLRFTPSNNYLSQYYYYDGLSSSALTEGSFKDKDGYIYISTINGITHFDPNEMKDGVDKPTVAFTDLKIFNKSVVVGEKINGHIILQKSISRTKSITLKHSENNFTLEFIALDFKYPIQKKYAHILEGYDKEWIYTDGRIRFASYNNLSPGKYILKVKVANNDGIWNKEHAELEIIVKTAPWLTWWAYLIYISIIIYIVYIVLRYYRNQQTLKRGLYLEKIEREHERELNDTRLRFYTNITHEIRTPLTLILSPLQDLIRKGADDEFTISHLNLIQKNTEKLINLVNQFLDLRKIDKDNMPLSVRESDIVWHISDLVENFKMFAKQKNIALNFISDSNKLKGWFDAEKVTKILNNLLLNAIKFTPTNGYINVFLNYSETNFIISVEDTGVGINESDIHKIFDRFYQADTSKANGTGIGLALVKNLIELHHGVIRVESILNTGTTFTISIPYTIDSYSETEITNEITEKIIKETTQITNDEKPLILVVEDDDDMRNYLNAILNTHFELILENNAKSAINSAFKYSPNLIISDLMMPGISGLELCKIIKSDFRTSHIPFIILTAKISEDDKIEGYKVGAEHYITKPFNSEQLLLQIKNIIAFRQIKIQEEIFADTSLNESDMSERELKFLDKLTQLIHKNIELTDYHVEEICKELFISRMQLHRKLKALTGKSTSEFIREVRMFKAKELLESLNYNVSEVMYMVGFKSNSHFSRAYKESFGILPSNVIKTK